MNGTGSGGVLKHPAVFGFRTLFYAVAPGESSFRSIPEVPNYVNQAIPFFFACIFIEMVLLYIKNLPQPRFNDAISSLSAGVLSQLPLIVFRNIEVAAYIYVWQNYRLVELPWDSSWTWFLAFLGVDLGYYWVHRAAHEVNFMWAAHQVHHSSEDYNLTTALRQSVLQRYSSWIFYLPMALFIPASVFLVHIQFNLLYQFWIHTEIVRHMGPLEWILNTPSHHRVHHGRNRYCIDRNYAAVLIIWDRMFGTFVAEGEEVAYGLVHPVGNWEPLNVQTCQWKHIIATSWNTDGFANKIKVFTSGPGWSPGKPRLGLPQDIPQLDAKVEKQKKYNKRLPLWWNIYAWLHFGIAVLGQDQINFYKSNMSALNVVLFVLYLLWTLTNVGLIYEKKWYAGVLELSRCVVFVLVDRFVCDGASSCPAYFPVLRAVFLLSIVIWASKSLRAINGQENIAVKKTN